MASAGRKFVELLASKLLKDKQKLDSDALKEYFRGSIDILPRSDLKLLLGKDFNDHFKYLAQLSLEKSSSVEKKGRKAFKEKNKVADTCKDTEFNLFVRGALDEVLGKAEYESVEQKATLYNHLWKCYPFMRGSEKLFSALVLSVKKTERTDNKFEDTLEAIGKYKQVTFGCYSEETIVECMKLFLSELTPWCEDCLKQAPSAQRKKRAVDLKSCIHNLVMLMHLRWLDCKRSVANVQCKESYRDHLAALMSLYFDMALLSESDSADVITTAGSLLFQVLGISPVLCMDVILQLSAITRENIHLVIPVIRSILKRNVGQLTNSSYVKFIYLSRSVIKEGEDQDFTAEIKQIAKGQAAPGNFVEWLKKHDGRLKSKLGLQRKMTGYQVTKELLQCKNNDALESLFDIACDTIMEETTSTIEDARHFAEGCNEDQEQQQDPVFFVDARGDVDFKQEVEYEEHDKEEKLLHRQLRTLIMQMEKDSDSEEEDINILPAEIPGKTDDDSLQAFSERLRREDTANDRRTKEGMDVQQEEPTDEVSTSGIETLSPADCNEVPDIKMIDDKDVNLVVASSQEDEENTSSMQKGASKTRSKKSAVKYSSNKHADVSISRDEATTAHQVADKRKGCLYSEENVAPQRKSSRKAASSKTAVQPLKKRQRGKIQQNTKLSKVK